MEVFLRPEARRQLQRAAEEYEAQSPGLGGEFLDDFLVGVEHLEEHPRLYMEVAPGIRRAPFRKFPYLMYYNVQSTHVQVLSIRAGRRRERVPRGA
jgi:toxin ParE1/3/4